MKKERVNWSTFIRSLAGVITVFAMCLIFSTLHAAENNKIADQDITNTIESEMLFSESVPSHLIDVETDEGVVTLSGSVSNVLAKKKALDIAETTRGVRSVVNTINVKPVDRSDKDVKNDVVNALLMDPATDSYEVDVTVKNGTVKLSGTVDAWQEKDLCSSVVRGVRGVREVDNNVTVDYKTDRPDTEIKPEVSRQLEIDALVDDGLIDVEVEDGVVKLSGTVGSAAEKRRARRDAWVAGVKNVNTENLEVKWWARDKMRRAPKEAKMTDEKIKKAVEDALLYDPRVYSFNPEVSVTGGVVTLTGEVENLEAKKAAEKTARNTIGVWSVNNLLRVRPKEIPTDSVLAERARNALKRDPYVDRFEIDVTVLNGKAYLYGTVDSFFEKTQAEEAAIGVADIIEVENNLDVTYDEEWKADWQVRQDIINELVWNPQIDADNVTVTVSNGVATLTGSVYTWNERRQATEEAAEGGAASVKNRLKVTYSPKFTGQ